MFAGSAIVSFYQMLNNHKPDLSVDEWLPFENDWQGLRTNSVSSLRSNTDEQLFAFNEPEDGTIASIALLGERNSGTRWIYG